MQTFREYCEQRGVEPVRGMRWDDYHRALGDTFIEYVDEVLRPAMEKASNPFKPSAVGYKLKPDGITYFDVGIHPK